MEKDVKYILIIENKKTKQQTVEGYFDAAYEALQFAEDLRLEEDAEIHIYKLADTYDYSI